MYGINKDLKLHFIGIGGIGMSGIAEVLLNLGYKVSGSDISESTATTRLREIGADVFIGHDSMNIQDVQLVVYSSAIDQSNPEIVKALSDNIPLIRRAEMLAELMRLKFGIAIAGSHGKTTTTSFIATILHGLKYDPTHIIGGVVSNLGGHARMGNGEYLVAEADESDGSFLYLNPIMSVITNIDNDHLDHYKTIEALENAFKSFANKVPFYGKIALNAHDEKQQKLIHEIKRPYVTFGIEGDPTRFDNIDFLASKIKHTADGMQFTVTKDRESADFFIHLAGKHNVLNALGAIAICSTLGNSLDSIANVIKDFKGVGRRLEVISKKSKAKIIDDYAHHPTEINATLGTVLAQNSDKDVIVIFEPHRYTRTQNFWKEFVSSFKGAKEVYILPIYAASEKPISYIDSEVLVKNINENGTHANYLKNYAQMKKVIENYAEKDVIVLVMGAGPISKNIRGHISELNL